MFFIWAQFDLQNSSAWEKQQCKDYWPNLQSQQTVNARIHNIPTVIVICLSIPFYGIFMTPTPPHLTVMDIYVYVSDRSILIARQGTRQSASSTYNYIHISISINNNNWYYFANWALRFLLKHLSRQHCN